MVAPGARDLATAVDDDPPTQFKPSFAWGKSADAATIATSWLMFQRHGNMSVS